MHHKLKEAIKRIHFQSIETTQKMWANLEPIIEREIQFLKRTNPKKYSNLTEREWLIIIRRRMLPEWCALIDKKFDLRSPRYGLTGEGLFYSKLLRCVSPKSYSIGEVHYHPLRRNKPSVTDIVSWVHRYRQGEYIFCIHTDFETVCYIFGKDLGKNPPEIDSFGLVLFGYPRSVRIKIQRWFEGLVENGKVKRIGVAGGC